MSTSWHGLVAAVVVGVWLAAGSAGAGAGTRVEAEALVDKAAIIVRSFGADPDLDWFRTKVTEAKALLIIPQNLKGAFFVGGSGGSGVLIARQAGSETWGYPAFYSIGSLSVGFQMGAEVSEIILMIMSERGMESLLTNSFKLGAEVTVAAGPIGGGATVKTADILSYSRSKGAFAGISLDGAVVQTRDRRNAAYYGRPVSPVDILIRQEVGNSHADGLRQAIREIVLENSP